MKRLIPIPILLIALALISGCGTMFQGSSQTIELQSTPSSSMVTAEPGIGEYTTPASVSLSRKNSYELTFEKDGYRPAKAHIKASAKFGYIVLDVLFTGLIGVVVDAVTGGWNGLTPENVIVTLEKEDESAMGPEKIDVELSSNGSKLYMDSQEDPIKVKIEVKD